MFRNVLEEPNLNILYKANFRSEFSWCFYQRMVINTFVPVLLAYSKFTGNINHRTKAVKWLSDLPPEDNAYTRDFINKNFKPTSALQSQGIIEYCMKKN